MMQMKTNPTSPSEAAAGAAVAGAEPTVVRRPRAHGQRRFLAWAAEAVERSVTEPPPEGAEARATALAVRRFRLDGACGPLLELARLYRERRSPVEELWDTVKDALGDPLEASAVLLGVSRGRVEQALRRLTEVGIADADSWSRNGAEPGGYVEDWFDCVYRPPVADEEELRARLVPLAPEPLLGIEAFGHLDGREDAVRLLTGGEPSRVRVSACSSTAGRARGKPKRRRRSSVRAGGRLYDLCES